MDKTQVAYVPSPRSDFVEMARTPSGRVFRKQILSYGKFAHPNIPGEKLEIDRGMGEKLVENFRNGVCDIVQVPIVDGENKHVEDPERNIGEVIDLTVEDDGVYASIDARKRADELGKTLLGASAMMHLDYTDTRTGDHVGPTLLHTAITNRPYITNLKGFEEVIAASADTLGEEAPVILTELTEDEEMGDLTKEELIDQLREKHGIDVNSLQQNPSTEELVQALSSALKEAGAVQFSQPSSGGEGSEEEDITITDVAEAVVELSQEKKTLETRFAQVEAELEVEREKAATKEVEDYVSEGRILPSQKDKMIEFARTDRPTFEALLPPKPIVDLSQIGATTHEPTTEVDVESEVDRIAAMANGIKAEPGGK